MTRWSVPKRDLISGVEMLLEKGELRIAKDMKDGGTLIGELMDMKEVTNAGGRVRAGACGWARRVADSMTTW